MTYEQMDRKLRELEPYEQKLKDKIQEPDYSGFKTAYYSEAGVEQKVFVMNYVDSDTFDDENEPGGGVSEHSIYTEKKERHIFMNKNARFAPVKPHIHDWVELGYMYSGTCKQKVGGNTVELKKGQIIILDSGIAHSIDYTGEDDLLINMLIEKEYFTHSFFTRLSEESIVTEFLMNAISEQTSHDSYILFNSEKDARIQVFMYELMCEFLKPTGMAHDIISNLVALLFSALVNVYEKGHEQKLTRSGKTYVVPILRYIEDNFRDCTLRETADKFNLNANYMTTLLKNTTGYTFKELVMEHRLQYASGLLLNTDLACEKIIAATGCGNDTYFYKKFREKYGCLPRDFRRRG